MLVGDIINSCSNAKVAEAALVSIGGDFASRIRIAAAASGLEAGAFVAQEVVAFAEDAEGDDWAALDKAMSGADHPILVGLRYILITALAAGHGASTITHRRAGPVRSRVGVLPRKNAESYCMLS